jgi:plasmid stability protein
MARILIRDLDDQTVERLKDRAKRHGRSLQGEAKQILTHAAGMTSDDAQKLSQQWHKKLAGRKLPDSTQIIREDRRR